MAGPVLRACGRRRDQLIAAMRGGTVGPEQGRDLLQQALILACLLDVCRSDAEAEVYLLGICSSPDRLGRAARQLRATLGLPAGAPPSSSRTRSA